MDSSFRLIALFGSFVLISACSINHSTVASSEHAPQSAATTTAPVAAAPGNTTDAAPKAKRLYLEDKTLTNDEVKALFAQGYKPTSHNGEVYYCRREQQLGTRFETTICRTAQQMKQFEEESRTLATEKQRASGCSWTDHGPRSTC